MNTGTATSLRLDRTRTSLRIISLGLANQKLILVVSYTVLITVALVYLLPFYWAAISSLKSEEKVFTDPPEWLPNPPMWSNYSRVLTSKAFPFFHLLRNTLFYAVLSTIGVLISSSVVAYGFARLNFWGKGVLFGITLSTMMLPGIVTLIPQYILYRWLGWVGTWAPLIVPHYFGNAFNIFLLRQFFMNIPWDLTDAAKVDGASELYILLRIVMPLVKPALLIVTVFHFLWAWNDFMGPLIYLDSPSEYPLVLGLSAFRTQHAINWNLIMAAAMVTTVPLLTLFFAAQRYFIEGVVLTGMKV